MKVYYLVILFSIISRNCFGQLLDNPIEYRLIDGYLYGENLENKKNDCKDCDNENKIFRVNKKFIYSYKYFDTNRNAFLFKVLDSGQWEFVKISSEEPKIIRSIELLILPNGEFFSDPFYCQTRIGYRLHDKLPNYETTGLIENKNNI